MAAADVGWVLHALAAYRAPLPAGLRRALLDALHRTAPALDGPGIERVARALAPVRGTVRAAVLRAAARAAPSMDAATLCGVLTALGSGTPAPVPLGEAYAPEAQTPAKGGRRHPGPLLASAPEVRRGVRAVAAPGAAGCMAAESATAAAAAIGPHDETLQGEMLRGEMLQGQMLQGEMLQGEMEAAPTPEGTRAELRGELLQGEMLQGALLQGEMLQGEIEDTPAAEATNAAPCDELLQGELEDAAAARDTDAAEGTDAALCDQLLQGEMEDAPAAQDTDAALHAEVLQLVSRVEAVAQDCGAQWRADTRAALQALGWPVSERLAAALQPPVAAPASCWPGARKRGKLTPLG